MEAVEIYVFLCDEGVDCWRPVKAIPTGNDIYQIVSENPDPENEKWQFKKGDHVRCVQKILRDSKPHECLVAIEKSDAV